MNENPTKLFADRLNHFLEKESLLHKKNKKTAVIRLFIFLLFTVLFIYSINTDRSELAILTFLLGMSSFLALVKYHQKVKAQQQYAGYLAHINKQEIQRTDYNFEGLIGGSGFIDDKHPYTSDLDIFGENSLFQYLCRTNNPGGQKRLANYLTEIPIASEVKNRQAAVAELEEKIDWRQYFQGHAHNIDPKHSLDKLWDWLSVPGLITTNPFLKYTLFILPILTIFSIIGALFFLPGYIPIIFIVLNILILSRTKEKVTEISNATSEALSMVSSYVHQLKMIEEESFSSPKLRDIKKAVEPTGDMSASKQIEKLKTLSELLEARLNPFFYIFFNFTILWDLIQVFRLDLWKKENGKNLHTWLDSIYETEALASIAGCSFANPAWSHPQINENSLHFEATKLAHPLIPENSRVANDLSLKGSGVCYIITGSNMSGKSTFLRTVGINIVLAMAGGKVCAEACNLSVMTPFSSMRTKDSLHENVSSFYAELKRLRQLLDLVKEEKRVIYLLDEILKGTNSADRHLGAMALVRQLIKAGVSGFVSTHDLELGNMEQEDPDHIKNFNFSSEIINQELFFDYKLKDGVCKSFNASQLMKNIGIDI
ncbi:MAG: MutS-related protein [Cytophagaceae bacterium]